MTWNMTQSAVTTNSSTSTDVSLVSAPRLPSHPGPIVKANSQIQTVSVHMYICQCVVSMASRTPMLVRLAVTIWLWLTRGSVRMHARYHYFSDMGCKIAAPVSPAAGDSHLCSLLSLAT